ncbi:uncharacterized protein LOC8023157 [Ixodes scapularis]|uniref:uncharacterized protein LOC8023157 n=1 Tax=Ixodes scapularis TaxID=6945 RepID=UPI001C3896C2|nr:uncharacterized protein LOC8023157 [Ixodes scapularis]
MEHELGAEQHRPDGGGGRALPLQEPLLHPAAVLLGRGQPHQASCGPASRPSNTPRFLFDVLFVKDSFGLVFMMTFLMRDVDELLHGAQAVHAFLTFCCEGGLPWMALSQFFVFQFHYRMTTHRQGAGPDRKHLFLLDVVYHVIQFSVALLAVASRVPPADKMALARHSLHGLSLLYHSYVLWSFFRWVRMTLPIVKTVACGSGRFLSPAMSRLLLFLLEAQGGNAPMLRLLERVLRLQEQVRQLARALQRQEGAPVAAPPGHNPDRLDRLALDQERHALADQRL